MNFIYKIVNPINRTVAIRITTGNNILEALEAANKIKSMYEKMIADKCSILYIRQCKSEN